MSRPWAWFYKTKQWTRTRDAYMKSRNGICERCGEPARIVHHKVWINASNINDPSITLGWDNLEALCQTCHNEEHHGSADRIKNDLEFDEDGNVIKKKMAGDGQPYPPSSKHFSKL
ncbi:MAG: HNH endonuclease [Solobacterium sp.]|nr:HNH endonuclease [Solobacterium sp.]